MSSIRRQYLEIDEKIAWTKFQLNSSTHLINTAGFPRRLHIISLRALQLLRIKYLMMGQNERSSKKYRGNTSAGKSPEIPETSLRSKFEKKFSQWDPETCLGDGNLLDLRVLYAAFPVRKNAP